MATEWRGEVSGEGRRGPDAAFAGRSRAAASPYVDARGVAAADGKWGEGGVSGGERSEWMGEEGRGASGGEWSGGIG